MKKILVSFSIIAAVAAVVIGATTAFFNDTETSTGNTFSAGAIDLQIDSNATYNGDAVSSATWDLRDLVPTADKFFNFSDIKPGDSGEDTISLHVTNNDAWACLNIVPTKNDDVSSNEPELASPDVANTDSIYDGELAQNMVFTIWADTCADTGRRATVGDNIYQADCDRLLSEGPAPITPSAYALATPALNIFTNQTADPLDGSLIHYLGFGWSIPTTVGNVIQTDSYQADISFYVEQSRNNAQFVCPPASSAVANQLTLENETIVQDGPWTIKTDNISGLLTWTGDANEFNYTLTAQGLPINTPYSLIYYADGWPGNNPGALIGAHSTDGSGVINSVGNVVDLGIDLPMPADGNYAIGAKIWLIPSSAYDSSTKSVIAWPPDDTWLFEGNVYIHYNDTNN